MPTITYNGQSFAIDGKRLWILGAAIHYARVHPSQWAQRIAAAKQAGFNTIQTSCPWLVHEPRSGRFVFDGDADIRQFIQTCGAAGMRVIVRVGPFVGDQYDGGGLPGWLIETPGVQLREDNPIFLEHVSRYFRRLISEIADLQATSSSAGPIILVQCEHAWICTNQDQADSYLHEVMRFVRESGITVPLINANDLWQDVPGTIDTWRGYDELLAHLRQLRTLQPMAPRLVSEFAATETAIWGSAGGERASQRSGDATAARTPDAALRRLAEILATGAQPVVSPFHAGTNFDFLAGRIAGRDDGFITTAGAIDPPLGEAGERGRKYHTLRRLVTFANHFSHVFAEMDPEYQPAVLDPEQTGSASRGRNGSQNLRAASIIAQRGAQGKVVFVFSPTDGSHRSATDEAVTLVLDDGIRLTVHLGDQAVGWFALDVDLQGLGRLDFSNICPWALVDRSIVVFQGPAGATAYISISGTPLEATVPAANDTKPLVLEHRGLTVVICNQRQIDFTYHDEKAVYVGVDGFAADGSPMVSPAYGSAVIVRRNAEVKPLEDTHRPAAKKGRVQSAPSAASIKLNAWQHAPARAHVTGESPRFASLEGPQSLSECGAPSGYGWYRVNLKGSGTVLCHMPHAADRLHVFLDGQRVHLFGVGPGASAEPFDLRLSKRDQTLVVLADNLGRFCEGNDLAQCKGLWGHLYRVKALRVKGKAQDAKPANPFEVRGFIAHRGVGHLSDSHQAVWTFEHPRKTPVLVDINGVRASGTFVLNDSPIAYFSGVTGSGVDRLLIEPGEEKAFRRGKNILRFAPDARQNKAAEEMLKIARLYECVEKISDTGSDGWAFAKWEPPSISNFNEWDKSQARGSKGVPSWWRSTFTVEAADASIAPLWLEANGVSKGQAYINGENLGRYFTATASGKPVGPQTRLYIPEPWLRHGQNNELMLFDEHGCEPTRVRLVRDAR